MHIIKNMSNISFWCKALSRVLSTMPVMTLVLCNRHYFTCGIKYTKQFWSLKITFKHSTYTMQSKLCYAYLLFFGSWVCFEWIHLVDCSVGFMKKFVHVFKNKCHKMSVLWRFQDWRTWIILHSGYLIKIGRVV